MVRLVLGALREECMLGFVDDFGGPDLVRNLREGVGDELEFAHKSASGWEWEARVA